MLRGICFGQCTFHSAITRVESDADVHFAVLLLLAAAPSDGISRDELVQILWPGEGDAGRHCLRQTLYRLRTLGILLRSGPKKIALADPDTHCDVHHVLHGRPDRDELVRLGLLRFLPGYAPKLGDAFRRWVDDVRHDVAARLRRALADEVVATRAAGRFHELGRIARALLAQDPLNEIGTIGLAESLVFEGSKLEALRVLDEYEAEVGPVNEALRVAPRLLRRRVSERVDDSLLPRRFDIPFVGREREFAELRAAFTAIRNGNARCAVLTGEAGIGKTRIATELMRHAALDGSTTASYSASAGDTFTPISTLVSVGQILLSLPGALGCAHEHLQYVRRLGTPDTVNVWSASGIAADIAYAQLVHSLAELVRALADEAPLVLLIDDAQRLHQTTWRVLFDVLDRTAESRFLLMLATRRLPEWFGAVCRDSCGQLTQHIRVDPFSQEDSLNFVRRWSAKNGVDLVPNDVLSCAEAAAGNPFYLGELTAHAARGGDMEAGPKSIRELIEVQCVALTKEAQRVLLVIALFEGRATLPRITTHLGYPSDQFMAVLEELEQAGLIAVVEGHLRCKHEFVAETATNLAMESVRAFVRVRIAEQLEAEADESGSIELLGDVVEHWERAAVSSRAYLASMKLGNRLLQIGLGTEADLAFERASRTAPSPSDEIAALEGSVVACHLSARWRRAQEVDSKRLALSTSSLGSLHTIPQNDLLAAEAALYSVFFAPNRHDLYVVARDRARPDGLRMRAASILAMWADNAFEKEAIEEARTAVVDLEIDRMHDPHSLLLQIIYHIVLGDRNIARERAEDLRRAADTSDDYSVRIQGLRRAGQAFMRVGARSDAEVSITSSLQLASHLRLPLHEVSCFEALYNLAIALDDIESAMSHSKEIRDRVGADAAVVTAQANISDSTTSWILNDVCAARILLDEVSAFTKPRLHKPEQAVLASRIAMELVVGGRVSSEEDVHRLEHLHRLGAGFGNQDFATSVVVSALRSIGDLTGAERTFESYVNRSRRDVFSYPKLLQRASERVYPIQ